METFLICILIAVIAVFFIVRDIKKMPKSIEKKNEQQIKKDAKPKIKTPVTVGRKYEDFSDEEKLNAQYLLKKNTESPIKQLHLSVTDEEKKEYEKLGIKIPIPNLTKPKPERILKAVRHAKNNTFDASYFVNPATGRFRFPKYNVKNDIVNIKNDIDYKAVQWEGLYPDEKQNYSIKEFEYYFDSEIILDSFWELFDNAKIDQLKPYDYLKNKGDELQELNDDLKNLNNDNEIVLNDDDFTKTLLDNGLFEKLIFTNENDLNKYIADQYKMAELREMCIKEGIKPEKVKTAMINLLRKANIELEYDELMVPTKIWTDMLNHFSDLYIENIRINIDQWHPFIIEKVWQEVIHYSECEQVNTKIESIISSKYWEERIETSYE